MSKKPSPPEDQLIGEDEAYPGDPSGKNVLIIAAFFIVATVSMVVITYCWG